MTRVINLVSLVFAALMLGTPARGAENYQTIDVPLGAARDLYYEITLSGKVYLHLAGLPRRGRLHEEIFGSQTLRIGALTSAARLG